MLCYFLIGIQIFITYLEFYVIATLALILLPFGVNRRTAFLGEKAIGAVLSFGIKLMVLAFIAAVADSACQDVVTPGRSHKQTDVLSSFRLPRNYFSRMACPHHGCGSSLRAPDPHGRHCRRYGGCRRLGSSYSWWSRHKGRSQRDHGGSHGEGVGWLEPTRKEGWAESRDSEVPTYRREPTRSRTLLYPLSTPAGRPPLRHPADSGGGFGQREQAAVAPPVEREAVIPFPAWTLPPWPSGSNTYPTPFLLP